MLTTESNQSLLGRRAFKDPLMMSVVISTRSENACKILRRADINFRLHFALIQISTEIVFRMMDESGITQIRPRGTNNEYADNNDYPADKSTCRHKPGIDGDPFRCSPDEFSKKSDER